MEHKFLPSAPGDTYTVQGHTFTVAGYDCIGGVRYPRLDIHMMSDEDWNRSALKNAIENYQKAFGRPPESDEEALAYNRWLAAGVVDRCQNK